VRTTTQILFLYAFVFFLLLKPGLVLSDEMGKANVELLQEYQLIVTGLTCKSCIPDVQKALYKLPGVKDVRITNFDKSGSATSVEVVPGSVSEDNLLSTLNADGFKAKIVSVSKPREVVIEKESSFSLFEFLN
jgi:copper chaperone CopZ